MPDVVVALVLEGWRGIGSGWTLGSGVAGCLTFACLRFLGVSGGGVDGRLGDELQVGVVGGGGSSPGSSGG